MSIFNSGFLQKIIEQFSRKEVTVFNAQTTTGFADNIETDTKYSYIIFQVTGDWDGEVIVYERFYVAAGSTEISVYDTTGAEHSRITENGTYVAKIEGRARVIVELASINSGSLTVNARFSNDSSLLNGIPVISPAVDQYRRKEVTFFDAQTVTGFSSVQMTGTKYSHIVVQITGDWDGIIKFGGRIFNAAGHVYFDVFDRSGNKITEITENGIYYANIEGWEQVRPEIISINSGSVTINGRYSNSPSILSEGNMQVSRPEIMEVSTVEVLPGFQSSGDISISENANSVIIENTSLNNNPIYFFINTQWNVSNVAPFPGKRHKLQKGEIMTVYANSLDNILFGGTVGYGEVKLITGRDLPEKTVKVHTDYDVDYISGHPDAIGTSNLGNKVEAVKGDKFVFSEGADILVSTDRGITVDNVHTFPNTDVRCHILRSGTILAFNPATDTVHRSADDGATFTQVLTGTQRAFSKNAIDEHTVGANDIVMFAEYGNHSNPRIMKSTDDGATWTSVYQPTALDLKHFHNLKFNPYLEKWMATSGDDDVDCLWHWSTDADGDSWQVIPVTSAGGQIWRAINIVFTLDGKILWSTDTSRVEEGLRDSGVFTISSSDLGEATFNRSTMLEQKLRLPSYSYGFDRVENTIYVSTRASAFSEDLGAKPALWVSSDEGETWLKLLEMDRELGQSINYGIRASVGVDWRGRVYYPLYIDTLNYGDGLERIQLLRIKKLTSQ